MHYHENWIFLWWYRLYNWIISMWTHSHNHHIYIYFLIVIMKLDVKDCGLGLKTGCFILSHTATQSIITAATQYDTSKVWRPNTVVSNPMVMIHMRVMTVFLKVSEPIIVSSSWKFVIFVVTFWKNLNNTLTYI